MSIVAQHWGHSSRPPTAVDVDVGAIAGNARIRTNSQRPLLLQLSSDCVLQTTLDVHRSPARQPAMSASSTKTSVAAISILACGCMAIAKFVVGIAIGSLALISEALHSTIDL